MCLSHLFGIPDAAFQMYKDLIYVENSLSLWGDLPPPFSVGFVKGWRRSVTCLVVADAIRALDIDFASLTREYKVHFVAKIQELHRNTMVHRASDVEDALMSGSFFHPQYPFQNMGCLLARSRWGPSMLRWGGIRMSQIRCWPHEVGWFCCECELNPSSILCCTNGPHSKFEDFWSYASDHTLAVEASQQVLACDVLPMHSTSWGNTRYWAVPGLLTKQLLCPSFDLCRVLSQSVIYKGLEFPHCFMRAISSVNS